MSTQRNTNQINNASYRVLAMLIGMIIGLAMDNIPVGLILGLSIGLHWISVMHKQCSGIDH